MTLPLAPPITQLQIYTEFGVPLNTPLSVLVRGGAWVPNTPQNANIPTGLPIAILDFIGAAAASVFLPSALVVESNASFAPQSAELLFYAEGELWQITTANGSERVPGAWKLSGTGAAYDVMWETVTPGLLAPDSNAPDVWHNLGTAVRFKITRNTNGFVERIGNIRIRLASTQAQVAILPGAILAIDIS